MIFDTKDSYLRSEERLIVSLGINNLIVIETNDSVLVAERIKGITITDITRLEKAGISTSKLAIEAIVILFSQVFFNCHSYMICNWNT